MSFENPQAMQTASTTDTQAISAQSLSTFTDETPSSVQAPNSQTESDTVESNIIYCEFDELQATPMGNYRKRRNPTKFAETKASVLEHGFLQNIVIREAIVNGETVRQVVAGYGRWEIAQLIFKETGKRIPLPCLNKGMISDSEALAIALDENNKRENDSISERAELAKEYNGMVGGDVATAALKLKVNETQFRELLQLTNCCPELLDALDDDNIKVFKGHCLVLSQFDKAIQQQTLAKIIADPDTYTVSYVKKRLKNLELSLGKAKFDTTDCQSCQHNTGGAMCFMFQSEDDDKCSNPSCYQNKSKLWLEEVRKKELEEKYGVVITTTMKPQSQVRSVDAKLLGDEQFNDCQSCQNNVVYLNDEPSEGFGSASRNICVDLDCHTKLFNQHQAKVNPPKAKKATKQGDSESAEDIAAFLAKASTKNSQQNTTVQSQDTTVPDEVNKETAVDKPIKQTPVEETKSVAKLSKKIQRTYANMLQKAVSSEIATCETFSLAFVAKAVDSKLRTPLLSNETIPSLTTRSVPELNALISTSLGKFFTQEVLLDSDAADISGFNANKVLREAFANVMKLKADDERDQKEIDEAKKKVIIESWTPSIELLDMFTTQQLAIICNESGFESAYCESKGSDIALAQVFNSSRKPEIIKEVLQFSYDWSNYAPKAYIELGLKYQKPA